MATPICSQIRTQVNWCDCRSFYVVGPENRFYFGKIGPGATARPAFECPLQKSILFGFGPDEHHFC